MSRSTTIKRSLSAEEGGVLHIIPSRRGRGAQRAARILVDRLNELGAPHHRLLALFDGSEEVDADFTLAHKPRRGRRVEMFDPALALRLRRFVHRLHPVGVVAHGGDAMKYAVPALLGSHIPLVYCVIGTYAGPPSGARIWLWRRIMASASMVVAVGNEVAQECRGRLGASPELVTEIPNGRDPTLYVPRAEPAEGPPTLIFVGALTSQKRADVFVEVVRRLRATGRPLRAVMVGDGPLAATLRSDAMSKGVEVLGARQDVPELLRAADVLLFPSLPAGEGMPGVLIEAGLSGVACVSTRVPGAAEVIEEGVTGLLVGDGPDAMVEAVGRLLDDEVQRSTMGAAARIRCESEFSLDLMARRWQTVLQQLVRQEPAGRPAGS
jgi:glycosyltransferase involved in cell wall biosynthesis